jgi:hypothetical protein
MIGAFSSGHNGFGNARRWFPYGTKEQVLKFWPHAQSHSPSLFLGPWRYKNKMATPKQKALCVLQFAKRGAVVSVQRNFRWQFQRDPPSATALEVGISSFRQGSAFKSAGRPRVGEESAQRVRQSVLRSPKESVRHDSRELEMWTICGGYCERDWKWSLIVFT